MAKWEQEPTKIRSVKPLAFRILIGLLVEGPHDYAELAEKTGLNVQTIRLWLTPFRKKLSDGSPRLVRIAEWHPDPRGVLSRPAFGWGSAPDAKRKRVDDAERMRRWRRDKKMKELTAALAGPIDRGNDGCLGAR